MSDYVWLLRDMERVDTGDEGEGRVVRVFANQKAAIETRARLENLTHRSSGLGYVHHFEIEPWSVDSSSLTDSDIAIGCIEGIGDDA